eukprot:631917-Amorphochlora_amoeboformis.AAC.1
MGSESPVSARACRVAPGVAKLALCSDMYTRYYPGKQRGFRRQYTHILTGYDTTQNSVTSTSFSPGILQKTHENPRRHLQQSRVAGIFVWVRYPFRWNSPVQTPVDVVASLLTQIQTEIMAAPRGKIPP